MIKDRLKEALIPAFITLAVFMGVLLAKGIFPFGDLRIDYYDMGQTNAPLYYHIWDFLHGKGGLFYSWYIDEGQNLSMGSSIQWNISVFNLFFLFIKRSAVMKSLSIFMGLHLFFMAFNMNLFLRHTVDTPRFYRILFSIAYGLTGFTLTHYTIPTYLDTAALMPLYLITLHDALAGRRYHGISEGNKKNAGTESPGGAKSPCGAKSPGGAENPSTVDINQAASKRSLLNPVTLYALMTAYMTALGYYMAFMNLIFVLLVSGTYIFILCGRDRVGKKCAAAGKNASNDSGRADVLETEKESRRRAVGEGVMEAQGRTDALQTEKESRRRAVGEAATRLGIGTFAGIGLSSFILLPAALQMMKSSRFNSNLSGGFGETMHDILWAIGADMYYIKWWLLSGSIAAIVILLCGMIRFRREVRQNIFCFLFCMYPCALIVFESINLLWHMGTYYHYPIRCGYLIPIVLLTTAAYYAGRYHQDYVNTSKDRDSAENSDVRHDIIVNYVNCNKPGLIIVSFICVIAAAALIIYYEHHAIWQIEELFRAWTVFALILAAAYFVIWAILKRPLYIAPLLIMELIVTAYAGYGQPHFVDRFSSDPEQSGDYVVAAQMLKDGLGIPESRTERIKNPDTTLNTNYGFIMRRATVGGWANTVPGPQMDSAIALGYGAHFMRILDCGGSLLSDAALHVTETLTLKPDLYTDEAWETEGEHSGYALLRNKYTLPFVMKTVDPGEDNALDGMGAMNFADATNALYQCLLSGIEVENSQYPGVSGRGGEENEAVANPEERESAPDMIIKDITDEVRDGEYYVNQQKALYLREGSFDELKINGKTMPVPDIGDPDGISYPAWFNSGVIFLGIYENKKLTIEGAEDPATVFYELDMQKLAALCESCSDEAQEIQTGRSSIDITIDGKAGQCALIPMAYDTGFKASVNGERSEIINASDIFMEVPLTDGSNHIHLSFTPDGLVPGIAISLIFLALIIFFTLKPVDVGALNRVSGVILAGVWALFLIVLYLIPYIAFVLHQIEKRTGLFHI